MHLDLEEQEQIDQIKHFWNRWGPLISWMLIVVLGAYAAYNGWQWWQRRNASQAAVLFDTVQSSAQATDMAMLERMPQRDVVTRTPWYEGARKFTGPLLRDVLKAGGAKGKTLKAIALNDYSVDIPFDDAFKFDVVLARLLDGKPMAVRDKGPLFIIYPFDDRTDLRTPQYFARCAWQLRTLEIV